MASVVRYIFRPQLNIFDGFVGGVSLGLWEVQQHVAAILFWLVFTAVSSRIERILKIEVKSNA